MKKELTKTFNSRKILFLLIFAVLALLSSYIPLFQIVGAKQKFTLFEFLGPLPGAFLGSVWGALAIFFVKISDFFINHKTFDLITIIRFFPAILAAIYFSTKSKKILLIPIACIILFWLHPVGFKVWYFSLYWFIPIIFFFSKNRLFLNSLGATFTAHAIGSTAFLYATDLPAVIWKNLIPQVALERIIFALGIGVSYWVLNYLLNYSIKNIKNSRFKKLMADNLAINQQFITFRIRKKAKKVKSNCY